MHYTNLKVGCFYIVDWGRNEGKILQFKELKLSLLGNIHRAIFIDQYGFEDIYPFIDTVPAREASPLEKELM